MIKSHNYSVTFPTNGISLKGSYDFEPGLTAVTGGNGTGKSFGTIEMIRYMLFGKQALRGPASDYKTLEAETVVAILGEDYTIKRTSKGESLTDASGDVLAVGAEAVNARLQKLLGMSLDVFDVVCAAVQKESDRLSKLRPAARKQLIDKTVGLTANEAVEKACKEEAKGLLREAEALRSALVAPIDPMKPDGYLPSEGVKATLETVKATLEQRRQLQAKIDALGSEPVAPTEPEPDVSTLERHEERRLAAVADVTLAKRQLAAMPEARYTSEELDAAQLWVDYESELRARGAPPSLTLVEIVAWEKYFTDKAVAQHMGDLKMSCPTCATVFCPGHDKLIAPAGAMPTEAELRAQLAAHDRHELPLVAPSDQAPSLIQLQIDAGRLALTQEDQRATLRATTRMAVGEDRSAALVAARQLLMQWSIYESQYRTWSERAEAAAVAQAALALLPAASEAELTRLNQCFVEACIYESQLEAWANSSEKYRLAQEDIEDRLRRADDFKLGAKRLAETRLKFKLHLVPTLSRIASSLISEMTGGVLTSVIVDEDMNITVNGQDISTLSGAGSTVANLALRISLGQVLVKGVLPIFMADEADSDMEEARAEYTMECLANLKDKLSQIIVITHKPVKFTDQVISLQGNDSLSD